MRHKHYISALSEYWALMPDKSAAYLELVMNHFKGADVLNNDRPKDFLPGKTVLVGAGSVTPYFVSEFGMEAPISAAPENSISVITLGDIITKHDGWCHAGIDTKAALLSAAEASPNIIGHIIVFDTPGGEARAPEKMVQAIQACTKPVFGYIDNLCASAGYWIASHCDQLFISGNMAQVGSIGAYITIVDHTKRLEAMGINLIEIYAEQSTMKNIEFREALMGKPERMRARITEMQSQFEATVREARGEKITDESVFTGSLLLGQKAIDAGLVDGIVTLKDLLSMVESEAIHQQKIDTINYY